MVQGDDEAEMEFVQGDDEEEMDFVAEETYYCDTTIGDEENYMNPNAFEEPDSTGSSSNGGSSDFW